MNKILLFIFTVVIRVTAVIAQTAVSVYTPNGSLVQDTYINPESLSSADVTYLKNEVSIEYPQATFVKDATSTYNCHAYAWFITEGGYAVWMGMLTNPTSIYWTDGSYIETSATDNEASKVSYTNDNHSAVTTATTDIFISKWGNWPLMMHKKDYCPYNSSQLRYFKKKPINIIYGPSNFCDSAIYTINGLPTTGATVTWSVNVPDISLQQNGNAVTLTKGNLIISISPASAHLVQLSGEDITLEATVMLANTTYSNTISKNIHVGVPREQTGTIVIGLTANGDPQQGDSYLPFIFNPDPWLAVDSSLTGYYWGFYNRNTGSSINPIRTEITSIFSPYEFDINSTELPNGDYTVFVKPYNSCGTSNIISYDFSVPNPLFYTFSFSTSPNPATSMLNLSVTNAVNSAAPVSSNNSSNQNNISNSAGVTNMYLYNANTGQLVKKWNYKENKSKKYKLNVSDVNRGIYILRMERDNSVASNKVILR